LGFKKKKPQTFSFLLFLVLETLFTLPEIEREKKKKKKKRERV
jgi:hypothetical protein